MSLHQLFCTNEALARETRSPFLLQIAQADRNHVKALRLGIGEHVSVVDASSDYFEVEITDLSGDEIWVRITQHLDKPEETIPVMLIQGLAKGDKMDTVARAATELGIAGFFPTEMKRSVVKLDVKKRSKRHERFVSIVRSASLQAGRVQMPQVGEVAPLGEVITNISQDDMVVLFWEEASVDQSVSALFDELVVQDCLTKIERIWIVIGPEGGLSAEEVQQIEALPASVHRCSLGPTILRTETAGIVGCALVLNELRAASAKAL